MTEILDKLLSIYSFKNKLGEVISWTEGQREIIYSIVNLGAGGKRFVQIECATQYGKSSAVAAALLMRCTKQEKWAIVAGTSDKAQIIMNYFIDYVAENPIARKLLQTNTPIERLKQERNKRRLVFMSGFEVQVFSADSTNKQATGNAIMGQNSPYVILDEAALVDDQIESKIFRMIAGFSKTKYLYIKVGNPFYRNHFLKSHNDPDYHQIKIDWKQGVREGRYTPEYIEKARQKPNFDVLYDVNFPEADAVDEKGWIPLLTEEDVERAMVVRGEGFGFLKLGIDPSGSGSNFNTCVGRYRNYAKILFKDRLLDIFELAKKVIEIKKKSPIVPMGYYVDKIGIGEGYYQAMVRDIDNVHGINVASKPFNEETFINLRAELAWKVREAIKGGLKLEKSDDWYQLAKIKYRTKLEGKRGKLEIMSKEEMAANGIDSPDCYDALALTFVHPDPDHTITYDETNKEYDKYNLFPEF